MRKYIRNYVEGGTYFFTMVTKNRKPLFQDPALCEIFMAGIEKTKIFQPFELEAYCILPDHIHLLMSLPESIKNYSNNHQGNKKDCHKDHQKHLINKIWLFGRIGFGSTPSETNATCKHITITSITIPSNMVILNPRINGNGQA